MFGNLIQAFHEQKKSIRFDPDYQAIISKAIALGYTLPSRAQQIKQNAYLMALKHSGIWNQLDIFYVFTNDGSKEFATLNWKNPNQFQCTLVNNPTWSASSGFTGNGTSSYIDTNWIPSSNGSNYTANDGSAFYYEYANAATSSAQSFGAGTTNSVTQALRINPRNGADQFTYQVNDSTSIGDVTSVTDARGFHHVGRTASGTRRYFKNGTSVNTSSATSVGRPTNSIYLLAMHVNSGATNHRASTIPVFGVGASLSGFESMLYNSWFWYNDMIKTTSTAYISDYQTILDRATTLGYPLPTENEKIWQSQLIYDLRVASIWGSLDIFYNFWVHNSDFATLNWKSPTQFQITKVNNPIFTKHLGFTKTATTATYLNTGWIPNTNGVNFSLNNCSCFVYLNDNKTDDLAFGSRDASAANAVWLQPRTASNQVRYNLNNTTDIVSTSTDSKGFWHLKRTSSTAASVFRNGTSVHNGTSTSTAMPSVSIHVMGGNNNGSPAGAGTNTVGCFGAGSSLNTLESRLYLIWDTYQALTAELDSDYKKVLDHARRLGYMRPSHFQKVKQSNLIKNLKNNQIWDNLDIFYNFATDGGSNFASLNWKNPLTYQCTLVNSPTLTTNEGFDFNGTTQYLNTGWAPSNGVKFTQNSGAFFIQVKDDITGDNKSDFGCTGASLGSICHHNGRNASGNVNIGINTSGGTGINIATNASSIGFYHLKRTSSTNISIFKDGGSLGSTTNTSQTKTTNTLVIGARNDNGTVTAFSDREVSCFGASASLDGLEFALYTAWNEYFTSL